MLSATEIVDLHDLLTSSWHYVPPEHVEPAPFRPRALSDLLDLVARQHRANFDLWHFEDEARAPDATEAELADVKRRVDSTNQRRNDLAEEMDRVLLAWLETRGLPNAKAPLHSESPGLIIDRLSILALKIHHTRDEADREDAP